MWYIAFIAIYCDFNMLWPPSNTRLETITYIVNHSLWYLCYITFMRYIKIYRSIFYNCQTLALEQSHILDHSLQCIGIYCNILKYIVIFCIHCNILWYIVISICCGHRQTLALEQLLILKHSMVFRLTLTLLEFLVLNLGF